ncbi:MAG TPA: CbiX/SirB N-terminal domain-containing protein [Glycomyces sp.]|nr:CbiX/SirB N-terminal domain-containing protein [Glycomyces sp.]
MLVAHGSPDPRSPEAVRTIARAAGADVGFLEFNEPHPVEVLRGLADTGVTEVVALPLLLTDAYHSRTDLPEVAKRAEEARPGLAVAVARPVGDLSLANALVRDLPYGIDGLVVCAAGTRVDEGRTHVTAVAAEAGRLLGVPAGPGFASGPGPRAGETVEALKAEGAQRVAAVCYFIAPGLLCDAAIESAREAGVIHVGDPIGTAPELIKLIDERAAEA